MDFDVIIAGGSFAGLAAAVQLRDKRVLLVEPHPIGAVQTSACGTLLAVLEATRTADSLLQVHNRILLHLGPKVVEFELDYPFCTFDYSTFCLRLLEQSNVDLLQARVLGHRGHMVSTTEGVFDAEVLVDATGWRAALATGAQTSKRRSRGRSFGLETTAPATEKDLHFYYEPKRLGKHKVAWLFPIKEEVRAGLASYLGETRLREGLGEFTQSALGITDYGWHGGYFPYRGQAATTDHVFRVGDAAGLCFPLTGEGIRPALYFSIRAARLARQVLAGEMREPDALREYRRFVRHHRRIYRFLIAAQWLIPRLPLPLIATIARLVSRPIWLGPAMGAYWRSIDPDELTIFREGQPHAGGRWPDRDISPIQGHFQSLS